ncbi:MAG: hypothetical protein ACR2HE_04225 [Casimicrobiaceae bacterium]
MSYTRDSQDDFTRSPCRVLDAEWLHEVVTAAKAPEAEVVCSATRT